MTLRRAERGRAGRVDGVALVLAAVAGFAWCADVRRSQLPQTGRTVSDSTPDEHSFGALGAGGGGVVTPAAAFARRHPDRVLCGG